MRSATLGIAIVAAAVLVIMVAPLVTFFAELVNKPDLFSLSYTYAGDRTVKVTLTYNGSVELKDLRIVIASGDWGQEFYREKVARGDTIEFNFTVDPNVSLENASVTLSFKIAGLYKFSVGVTSVSGKS